MKDITEIKPFLDDVLGHNAAQVFDENMDEFIYYVRFYALSEPDTSSGKMRSKLRKLAEGILAMALKRFLEDNYTDESGQIDLNVADEAVYDRNMQPIDAIEKIRNSQKEMMSLMVSRGMYEFAKGKCLAKSITDRIQRDLETSNLTGQPEEGPKTDAMEQIEIQIMRLERRLPKLDNEDGRLLLALYGRIKELKSKPTSAA